VDNFIEASDDVFWNKEEKEEREKTKGEHRQKIRELER
jgi:hypothetical protein